MELFAIIYILWTLRSAGYEAMAYTVYHSVRLSVIVVGMRRFLDVELSITAI